MPTTFTLPPRNLGTTETTPALTFTHANPLDPDFARLIAPGASVVAWAGWFDPEGDPASGHFPSDHRLWTTGLESLRQSIARLDPILQERESHLWLRPALGLVLSDPHSVSALLKEPPSDRVRILVDPVAMLTPEMAKHAEDHLPRMLGKLGNLEACSAIVLSGGKPSRDDRMSHVPLGTDQPFDRALLANWRDSAFAERDVFVLTQACRALIEGAKIA